MRISKYMGEIPMAHMLENHDRRCQFLHGHNYKLNVTVEGPLINIKGHPKNGMVIDFTDLKDIVKLVIDPMDHAFIISGKENFDLIRHAGNTFSLQARTTVENIGLYVFRAIAKRLEVLKATNEEYKGLELHSIEMWETDGSKVTVTQDDI